MNGSYKCAQCGLINWTIDDFCKRCGIPNPFSAQTAQAGNAPPFAPQNQAFAPHNQAFAPHNQAFAPQTNMAPRPSPPVRSAPDYSIPPPPNVFGNGVGTNTTQGFNGYQNRPPVRDFNQPLQSPKFAADLQKAEKQIRDAWISGVIVCSITLLFAVITSAASSKSLSASPLEMAVAVFIYGGLTLGVFFKNRVCAILLCGLFVLDKIVMLASGQVSGILVAVIFIYYFACGVQGTFAYHKLMKQRA